MRDSPTVTEAPGEPFELDADTTVKPTGEGLYEGELTGRWNVGIGMNGGYLAAFCLRGVLAERARCPTRSP